MSTLLIRNIAQLVTCDDGDRILQGADLYCEDGFIKTIGRDLDVEADRVIDTQVFGVMPLSVVIDQFYNFDLFAHAWDLAKASGQDASLDEDYAAGAYAGMSAMGTTRTPSLMTRRLASQVCSTCAMGHRLLGTPGRTGL